MLFLRRINRSYGRRSRSAKERFIRRQWPEDYVFPACDKCQHVSNKEEALFGFVARCSADLKTNEEKKEVKKYIEGLWRRWPEAMRALEPNEEQKATYCRHFGLSKETHEVPILSARSMILDEGVRVFVRKLACALYYKHLGKVLAHKGAIYIRWFTGMNALEGSIPPSLFQQGLVGVEIQRQKTSLHEQFEYRYAISENQEISYYLVMFGHSILIAIFVFEDQTNVPAEMSGKMEKPFQWQ